MPDNLLFFLISEQADNHPSGAFNKIFGIPITIQSILQALLIVHGYTLSKMHHRSVDLKFKYEN